MKRLTDFIQWIFNRETLEPVMVSTFSNTQRRRMATKFMAVSLSAAIAGTSVPVTSHAAPMGASFSLPLSKSIGFVSDVYSAKTLTTGFTPDVILIQDLHANRSVQFAISKILKTLKGMNLLPNRIAVEGQEGPVDVSAMQKIGDAKSRTQAADYLIRQGEMPGDFHYVVTEGEGSLYGIETMPLYQSALDFFAKSYQARMALRENLSILRGALQRVNKETPMARTNAAELDNEIAAVEQLANLDLTPEEFGPAVKNASAALLHLQQALPKDEANTLLMPVSAAIDYYVVALMRDKELFKNSLKLRALDHQTTTVMVVGGFHTDGITQLLKQQGLSYAVISPNVRKHSKIDEMLYINRMLGKHLTPEQLSSGKDWAAAGLTRPFHAAGQVTASLAAAAGSVRRLSVRAMLALVLAGAGSMALGQDAPMGSSRPQLRMAVEAPRETAAVSASVPTQEKATVGGVSMEMPLAPKKADSAASQPKGTFFDEDMQTPKQPSNPWTTIVRGVLSLGVFVGGLVWSDKAKTGKKKWILRTLTLAATLLLFPSAAFADGFGIPAVATMDTGPMALLLAVGAAVSFVGWTTSVVRRIQKMESMASQIQSYVDQGMELPAELAQAAEKLFGTAADALTAPFMRARIEEERKKTLAKVAFGFSA